MFKVMILVLAVLAVASAQYLASPYYGGYGRSYYGGSYPTAYSGAYATPYAYSGYNGAYYG